MDMSKFQTFEKYKFHDGGATSPVAVMLEDDDSTIEAHIKHLLGRNFSLYVTPDPMVAKRLYRTLRNEAIYFFDMHMTRFKRIGSRDTKSGVIVGFALICDITDDGRKDRIRFCSTLTEFESEKSTNSYMRMVENNGQPIINIRKDNEFAKFEELVSKYEAVYSQEIKVKAIKRNVEALASGYTRLAPADANAENQIPSIFGYPGVDSNLWHKDRDAVYKHFSAPDRERCEVLAYILEGLILFFGDEDVESQSHWLSTKREEMSHRSAWELICSGSMSELFFVANFVNRVLG
jgi:hypothetical protein